MGLANTHTQARLAVFRLTGWQCALTVTLSLIAWLAGHADAAVSVLVGGSIGAIAGLYQAMRLLSVDAGTDPEGFMRSLWVSEAVKIVVTVALFILAIRLLRVAMVPTIVGYAVTYIVYWVALGTSYPWFEPDVAPTDLRERNWPEK